MYVCMCKSVRINIYVCLCVYVCESMFVCVLCVYVCKSMFVYVCVYVHGSIFSRARGEVVCLCPPGVVHYGRF